MQIYGILYDAGDGSAYILWHNEADKDFLLSDDYEYPESVYLNEGTPAATLNFPDGISPADIGIKLSSVSR